MHFLLSYDLVTPGRDYSRLLDTLHSFGAVRVLASQWTFTRYQTDAAGLTRYFRQFIDTNDRLLVVELTGGVSAYNLINEIAA